MVTYSLKEVFVVFKLKVTFKTYYMCYWSQATDKKTQLGITAISTSVTVYMKSA